MAYHQKCQSAVALTKGSDGKRTWMGRDLNAFKLCSNTTPSQNHVSGSG